MKKWRHLFVTFGGHKGNFKVAANGVEVKGLESPWEALDFFGARGWEVAFQLPDGPNDVMGYLMKKEE